MNKKMKTILVTGGSGFIGSHLCEELLKRGNHVLCMDNQLSGSFNNIRHIREDPNFELILHDVVHPIYLNVDEIYHLACPASPKDYQMDPIKTIQTNVLGTLNILEMARKSGSKILLTSTSEVYGDPKIYPQTEEYWGNVNPIGVRSCYDEGKRLAECLMMEYHRAYKVNTRIARIFNTYGPRLKSNDGRVISNFIVQALYNKPITIYGSGHQTRSFCYITDQIDGLIKLMGSDYTLPINIGNTHEMSVLDIASKILRLTKSSSSIIFKDLPQDDPLQRKPDITRARTILDWEPKIEIDEGLTRTISYFKDRM